MPLDRHSSAAKAHLRWITLGLHLGFTVTGIGTVLLGCILPRLSAVAHLRDKDAGLLLMAQFAAAALGALLVRRNFWHTLAMGYVLTSASSFSIVALQTKFFLPAFALLGLGLGLAMTSTSMLIGRLYPARKGSALAVLNFFWSIGAVLCPIMVSRFLDHGRIRIAYVPVALLAAFFACLPLLTKIHLQPLEPIDKKQHPTKDATEIKVIIYFAVLAFLYVGIEATVGNWMSTYAIRDIAWTFSHSTWAVSIFWSALLLGRAITPAILHFLSERSLYRASILVVIAGVSLILLAHSPIMLLTGAACTGFALAPLYPLILSLFMTEIGESQNIGWVFAIAGLGGAVLSELTGEISTAAKSLRLGLLVPAGASLLMAIMMLVYGGNRKTDRI